MIALIKTKKVGRKTEIFLKKYHFKIKNNYNMELIKVL